MFCVERKTVLALCREVIVTAGQTNAKESDAEFSITGSYVLSELEMSNTEWYESPVVPMVAFQGLW